jgi:hypothetical protein
MGRTKIAQLDEQRTVADLDAELTKARQILAAASKQLVKDQAKMLAATHAMAVAVTNEEASRALVAAAADTVRDVEAAVFRARLRDAGRVS